jgi:adenylyltransferase/sulfurtransferase
MRFLIFDDLTMDFMDLKIERNSHCPVYGNHPTVTELIDYELS